MKINNEIDFGEFKLIPSNNEFLLRNEKAKNVISLILQRYFDKTNQPIKEFTILLLKNKGIVHDYNEDERNLLFSFAEIIAFSGLAARSYFNCISGYSSRDNFIFIIQGFGDGTKGVTVVSRRRDGNQKSYYSGDKFSEKAPYYINIGQNLPLDVNLAKALLSARQSLEASRWPYYSDAIFSFNLANTDDDNKMSIQQEIVLLIGAIQRLLEYGGSNKGELSNIFVKYFDSIPKFNLQESKRLSCKIKYKSIFEAWINDLYAVRGDFAHGRQKSSKVQIWKPHEHLLLGSYLFPLLVKIKLTNKKFYTLTKSDEFDINVFEPLADADLFAQPKDQLDWEWGRIRDDYSTEQEVNQLVSKFIEDRA